MPSMKNILGATAALAGMATAIPQGPIINSTLGYNSTVGPVSGYNSTVGPVSGYNSTTGPVLGNNSTTSPVSGANSTTGADDSFFCPRLNGEVYVDGASISYLIECNTNHFGIVIDIAFNSTLFKRQAAAAPTSLADCLTLCDATASCVGTAFDAAAQTCTLYSEVGAAYSDVGTDFAVKVSSEPATSATAGQTLTSTLYSTTVRTISSCAPTVTDCPLKNGASAVITEVIPVTSTEYICPSATVIPVKPVACGCAYSASTVSAYSASVVASGSASGSTVLVGAYTTVIAIPAPSATSYSAVTVSASCAAQSAAVSASTMVGGATVSVCPGCPVTSVATAVATVSVCPGCPVPAGASAATAVPTGPSAALGSATSSSGLAVYTGAATQIKAAGAGLGAIVAAAAVLL